jgi:hypothetical protein
LSISTRLHGSRSQKTATILTLYVGWGWVTNRGLEQADKNDLNLHQYAVSKLDHWSVKLHNVSRHNYATGRTKDTDR